MKLKWHDFLADPEKYQQSNPRDVIVCGAQGLVKTYGVHRDEKSSLREVWISVSVGPLLMREMIVADEQTARNICQKIEDGTYPK